MKAVTLHAKSVIYTLLVLIPGLCLSQEAKVTLGNRNIALNDVFTITLTVSNESIKSYSGFPEIRSFNKVGTSSQTSTNIMNNKVSVTQSIIQNYQPTKEGTFTLPDFSITVNDKTLKVTGMSVTVGPPRQRNAYNPFGDDIFEEFFGRKTAPTEFVEVKDDAFFSLSTSKDQVYVGEGFHVELAFYVSETNRAEMQFYDLTTQLGDILKKVKPKNCWEENFNISEITRVPVVMNGKPYVQYKIYEADFFPLSVEDVRFPAVGLNMIKYKVAKNPSFFSTNRQQDFKMFNTKTKVVRVKALPPHPLKDQVAVGVFKLEDAGASSSATAGKALPFTIKITGIGNISSLPEPQIINQDLFEIYPPNIRQNINRNQGYVSGSKAFDYFIAPKEPGTIPLSSAFSWVYFNTSKNRYDTLQPKSVLQVGGQSQRDKAIQNSDLGLFYGRIDKESNAMVSLKKPKDYKVWYNIALGLAVFLILGMMIKRANKPHGF
jgi:hypothetical protein